MRLLLVAAATLGAAALHAQITSDPIPEPIQTRGLAVEVGDVVRCPATANHVSCARGNSAGQ